MLDYDFLREYELKERNKINRIEILSNHDQFITTADDLYPDINISNGIVYPRGNVPIKLLLLFYDKIAIFVPPANKSYFEKKYSMTFDDFLTLSRKGIILPVIAHPTDYVNNDDFDELFELNPPSIWARGISLVNTFNMDFDEAERVLPLKRIAAFTNVRKQWRRHYPDVSEQQLTQNIIRELSTLFADLMVFGYQDVLYNLVDLKIPEFQMVYYLKTLNELLTYPYLFGLGGTPVIDYKRAKDKFSYSFPITGRKETIPDIISPSLRYILEDFDIYINDLSIAQLVEYHQENYAEKMRQAIKNLQNSTETMFSNNTISLNSIYDKAEIVKFALDDFHKRISSDISRKLKNIELEVANEISLSSLSMGNFLVENQYGENVDIAYLSRFNLPVGDMLPSDIQKIVSKEVISKRFSPSVATLWEIRNNFMKKR
ncbi:MAG: hypothetical protein HFH96_04105 [Lachnospiraceae bacterium]|jgi:hypothetical protein|nr:hypothetical protein [uncultured Acetatifactor sp.]MCI9230285.1 hypothetical protein [Lachnospiraceae bacterium]